MILFSLAIIAYVSQWFLIALVPMVVGFLVLNIIFTSGVSVKNFNKVVI
jgi:hypothetical protein